MFAAIIFIFIRSVRLVRASSRSLCGLIAKVRQLIIFCGAFRTSQLSADSDQELLMGVDLDRIEHEVDSWFSVNCYIEPLTG